MQYRNQGLRLEARKPPPLVFRHRFKPKCLSQQGTVHKDSYPLCGDGSRIKQCQIIDGGLASASVGLHHGRHYRPERLAPKMDRQAERQRGHDERNVIHHSINRIVGAIFQAAPA